MISRTKNAGISLIESMFISGIIAFVTIFMLGLIIDKPDTKIDSAKNELVVVKYDVLQPVVTDIKSYNSSPNVTALKLTPVLTPEMRRDPIQPVAPEPVAVAPQPIIEKNETHYHFEDLNSGITYFASTLLVIFLSFCCFKGMGKLIKNLSVKKAIKKSKLILTCFETDINNSATYLDYTKIITDQLRFNQTTIEQNKNSYHIPELSVVNDKLVENLTFAERNLVNDLR